MEIDRIHVKLMKDIYFMPCIGSAEMEEIKSQLRRGRRPEIGLSARHQTDYVPANITVFHVVEVISRSEHPDSRTLYNLHRIKVAKDDAEAVIILDFPEHMFSIEESNNQFNELILRSLEWSRR